MINFASRDLTADELNNLVLLAGGKESVRKVLSGELKIQLLPTSAQTIVVSTGVERFMTVEVNLPFKDRIKRGNYSWVHKNLTEERFPVTVDQIGEWEWELFRFGRKISSQDAIRLMKKYGYDAGQIGHILTLGEKYHEEQLRLAVIGLGSVAQVDSVHYVPGLWDDRSQRGLDLYRFDDDWGVDHPFLGVRRRSVD